MSLDNHRLTIFTAWTFDGNRRLGILTTWAWFNNGRFWVLDVIWAWTLIDCRINLVFPLIITVIWVSVWAQPISPASRGAASSISFGLNQMLVVPVVRIDVGTSCSNSIVIILHKVKCIRSKLNLFPCSIVARMTTLVQFVELLFLVMVEPSISLTLTIAIVLHCTSMDIVDGIVVLTTIVVVFLVSFIFVLRPDISSGLGVSSFDLSLVFLLSELGSWFSQRNILLDHPPRLELLLLLLFLFVMLGFSTFSTDALTIRFGVLGSRRLNCLGSNILKGLGVRSLPHDFRSHIKFISLMDQCYLLCYQWHNSIICHRKSSQIFTANTRHLRTTSIQST